MTLSDHDMKMLNDSAIKIIRALKIQGGCNVQFALNPKTSEYFLIEINLRVSRSSAREQGQRLSHRARHGQGRRRHEPR